MSSEQRGEATSGDSKGMYVRLEGEEEERSREKAATDAFLL